MSTPHAENSTWLRDLGDGLVLRRATPADADALSAFNARIHSNEGPEYPDGRVGAWTRDLLTRPHPSFQPGDFTVVEDTRTQAIVSSTNLISQTWSYAGIPFEVGRPELVGTAPEYRQRGLVRAQFAEIHRWSAARGQVLQAITGIPYYYRQFEYEMAVDLEAGRIGYSIHVPRLAEGSEEPCRIRAAAEEDLPFIAEQYARGCQRSLVSCIRDEEMWRYELNGKSSQNISRMELRILERPDGERLGFLAHPALNWGAVMALGAYELKAGVSWAEVTPSVIRYLYRTGETYAAQTGTLVSFGAFGLLLGQAHPAYEVLHYSLPYTRKPYTWYLRVPDLAGFLQLITPVLNQRLAASAYAAYSGEMKITFYQRGLLLTCQDGRLVDVAAWQPTPLGHSGNAAFPSLTFLQLLFGHRTFDELAYIFPDCWCRGDQYYGLLSALFPQQASDLWPVA